MKMTKVLVAAMLFAAATSSVFAKAKDNKKIQKQIQIYDRQGFAEDRPIPNWVYAIIDGERSKVQKELKLDGKQIFVFNQNNEDLDFLKTWTDNVDVRAEVSKSINEAVGQATEAFLKESQGDETSKKKAVEQTTTALSTVTITGLMKEAQYWIQYRRPKQNVKKAKKDSDYDYYYTYYVVFAIDQEAYQKQLDEPLKNIEENTSESEALRKTVSAHLRAPLLPKSDSKTSEIEGF